MQPALYSFSNQGGEGDEPLFAAIAEALAEQGYCVLPGAMPPAVADALAELAANQQQALQPAGVGRLEDQTLNRFIRRDKIAWIEPTTEAGREWLAWTSRLQTYLNRRLFLGLFSFESHLAVYQAGDFYKKHLDAFKGQGNRVLSLVTYLNRDWLPDQGGELLIYHPESGEPLIKVTPNLGTLVMFLSEDFPHEVLPAKAVRMSVAGWFRVNGSTNQRVDPPR